MKKIYELQERVVQVLIERALDKFPFYATRGGGGSQG